MTFVSSFDVIILGGGPAAASAAISVSRTGLRAVLLFTRKPRTPRLGETLAPEATLCLEELRLDATDFLSAHTAVFRNTSSWGTGELDSRDYIYNPYGMGWRVDRTVFDQALRVAAVQNGTTVISASKLEGFSGPVPHWSINFLEACRVRTVIAPWIIDCTGRSRWLARRLGARVRTSDRRIAFALEFEGAPDMDSSTLVETVAGGWWYSSQTTSASRIAVFYTDPGGPISHAREREGFLHLVGETRHVKERIAVYPRPEGKPVGFPANSSVLLPASGRNWLAAGDACVTVDPLASMGLMNALRTGTAAAETILSARARSVDSTSLYDLFVTDLYEKYLTVRRSYYFAELRWQQDRFWNAQKTDAQTKSSAASVIR
jgi:flavin-dependent dehydrogenase